MGFDLGRDSTQLAQFIVLMIFTPIGIAVMVLRFIATRRSARKLGLEDWMAALATLFFVLTNLGGLVAIDILNGRPIAEEIVESPSDYKHMRKWDMAALYFYFGHMLFVKLSVLALYHRIFGVNRAYMVWIWVLGGIQFATVIGLCIFQALQCRPFDRYFDISIPGSCKAEGTLILAAETPNSLVDFAMVILAMAMIRPLQLPSVTKWRLRILFGLGSLVGIIGFVKIAITYSTSVLFGFSMVSIWSAVQMFVALLCCCLPVIHPIIPFTALWSRFSSRLASFTTFGRVSHERTKAHSPGDLSKRSDPSSVGNHDHGWDHLDEDNSTKGLAWPETTYHAETHALGDFRVSNTSATSPALQV